MDESPSATERAGTDEAVAAARDRVVERLVAFARTLRADGATVPADASVAAADALSAVGLTDRRRVRAATRATLVAERADLERFERHFPAFWRGLQRDVAGEEDADADRDSDRKSPSARTGASDDREASDPDREEAPTPRSAATRALGADAGQVGGDRERAAYSPGGDGTRADAAEVTSRELDARDLEAFTSALATVAGRRWASGSGPRADLRRALRESVATGGAVTTVPSRRRPVSVPSYCLIVDVSRSVLDAIDRGFLVALLAGLHRESRATRTFFFDTGVRDVTAAFERADDPLAALADAEVAWGGGTRIGRSIATIRRDHPHAVDRETVAIVLSDGFDVGDLDTLEAGMAWLRRRAAGVLWLNPLAGTDDYEPTCRGMARALPYVDGLFSLTASADLREVGRQIDRRGLGGRIGYEYVRRG